MTITQIIARRGRWGAALALCVLLLGVSGCTKPGTFTDPEPRCAITAESVLWGAAYIAAHMFAHQ